MHRTSAGADSVDGRYDYVIVGAGSAGCILAARLSEDPDVSVALLEAGGSDMSVFIKMPSALSYPMNMPKFDWGYHTEPEPGLDGRKLHCPRGRVLGGSSSINGMVFVRGHARDIDEWAASGAEGWNYAACLPYYRKMETWVKGADDWRGGDGPLAVCTGNDMALNPLYQCFIDAGQQAGYPFTADYNGHQQEGFGQMHMNVDNGIRASTAHAWLADAASRSNLAVLSHCTAERLLMESNRIVGVAYRSAGRSLRIHASREVVLSAGSIGSPALLQRSGLGPRDVLEAAGVHVEVDMPGVGANLQDHLEVYFQYRCRQPVSLNRKLSWWHKGIIGARWLATRTGLGATNHFEACAFIRSRAGLAWPNLQYHFLPGAMRYDGRAAFDGDGFQMHVGPNKPFSRGSVRITSADPVQPPRILFNYLEHPQDRQDWRDCIRLSREIVAQAAFDEYRDAEIQPGAGIESDADIDTWVRANVESAYHPSCTVKMGSASDPMAVLDSECRVRGVDALRVVDSSVFPTITNGNLNAPTMMVAERAADLIRQRGMLPASDAEVWLAADWQTTQRSKHPAPATRDARAG